MSEFSKEAKKSKYAYIDQAKLDDMYHTQLTRELWSVPLSDLNKYIKEFYPNPTALEFIEIKDLTRIVTKLNNNQELTKEEEDTIKYKHNRMYGRIRQVIELSGRDGGAISVNDMSDQELDKALASKFKNIAKALTKVKNESE